MRWDINYLLKSLFCWRKRSLSSVKKLFMRISSITHTSQFRDLLWDKEKRKFATLIAELLSNKQREYKTYMFKFIIALLFTSLRTRCESLGLIMCLKSIFVKKQIVEKTLLILRAQRHGKLIVRKLFVNKLSFVHRLLKLTYD